MSVQSSPKKTVSSLLTSVRVSEESALYHLRKGDVFALQGEWPKAKKEYEEAVRKHGGLPALRKLAQAELQQRNIRGVQNILQQLRQEGAREEDILLLEGVILLRTGELEKVQHYINNASDSPHKSYILALLSIIQGKHNQAQEYLQDVTLGWEPILRAYGSTLQSAYDEYALFPQSPSVHLTTLLSRALAEAQECELALPLLAQVVQQEAAYRDAWIVQGYCELVTERLPEALASLERAYSLDPQKPEIQYFLGRTYAALGNSESALVFYEYALKNGFSPEKEVRIRIAELAQSMQRYEEALTQYTVLLSQKEATPDLVPFFVQIALQAHREDEVYLSVENALQKWPDTKDVLVAFSEIAVRMGKIQEARKALEKASFMYPNDEKIHQLLREL